MLDSHPDLAVPAESGGMILQFCHGLPVNGHPDRLSWPPVETATGPHDEEAVSEMVEHLALSHRYQAWRLDPAAVVHHAVSAGAASRADVIRAVYAVYARAQGKGRYADKTPGHGLHLARLSELFPEAVFVHVVRDGRDVALSMVEMSWGPTDLPEAALHWADRVTRTRQAGTTLGPGRYLEVFYEDLIIDPVSVLTRVCVHAGLEYDPRMLDYRPAAGRQLAMSPAPHEDRNLTRPLTAGLRDWRTEMAPDDVATFEALVGPVLEELGYATRVPVDAFVPVARRAAVALAAVAGRPMETW